MAAMVLHKVPDCPHLPPTPIQTPDIIGVQKGAHIKLIRYAPFPDPSFIRLSKVPENEPPPPSPPGVLMERVARFQSLLLTIRVPRKRPPPHGYQRAPYGQ
jgi:hypothetical protein